MLFSIGLELAMLSIGQHLGAALITSCRLWLVLAALFVFSFIVTAAEPDLAVLANQVASIPNLNLVIGISVGVGFFLMVAVLRAVFHWKLGRVLSIAYPIAFIVALFSSDYLAVAIDSAALPRGRSRCPSCWPSSAAARPRPATATPRTTTSASAPSARWAHHTRCAAFSCPRNASCAKAAPPAAG